MSIKNRITKKLHPRIPTIVASADAGGSAAFVPQMKAIIIATMASMLRVVVGTRKCAISIHFKNMAAAKYIIKEVVESRRAIVSDIINA